MKSLKGTETEKNLLKSFAGESQARNRYTYFASAAKKEGLVQISAMFERTADQEKEHAKRPWTYRPSTFDLNRLQSMITNFQPALRSAPAGGRRPGTCRGLLLLRG